MKKSDMAVQLDLCECEEHGRLVFPTGEESEEFCSKEAGFIVLDSSKEKLTEKEWMHLGQEITRSSLPTRIEEENPLVSFSCSLYNMTRKDVSLSYVEPTSKYVH
jgi:hypothetical protein